MLNGNELVLKVKLLRRNKVKKTAINITAVKAYAERNEKKKLKKLSSDKIEKKSEFLDKLIKDSNSNNREKVISKSLLTTFDLECECYYKLMKEKNFHSQRDLNYYLTQENKWDDFPEIRAINTHGEFSGIRGITPKAYAKVCRLMDKEISSGGRPLVNSERY